MIAAPYSFGEVAWLNSLTYNEAIDLTATPKGALGHPADDRGAYPGTDASDDMVPLPVIARWLDVQAAKRRLRLDRDVLAMVQLRAQGVSEEVIATMYDSNHKAIGGRVRSALREIVADLNRGYEPIPERLGHIDLCLACGVRPRARLCSTRRRVRGGWKTIREGKQSSVCSTCLAPALGFRLVEGPVAERSDV